MKILHVIRGLANSSGTTHIVIPLAEEQARQGHDVTVWHVAKPGEPSLAPDAGLVTSRCFPTSWPHTRHLGWSRLFMREMHRHVADFDVVHVHAIWNLVTTAALRAAIRAGVPVVVAPQGSCDPVAWRIGSPLRRIYATCVELPLLRKTDAFQALSHAEARQISAMGLQGKATIIPNGVDAAAYAQQGDAADLRSELGLHADTPLLLHLGRLHPKKGIDLLIRAIALLQDGPVPPALIVAGHDAGTGYANQLTVQAERETPGRVHFIGEVSGRRKQQVLCGADIFVLASRSEGLPVAALEAMASGLPVVLTTACNIPAAAAAGRVVPPQPEAIAAALSELLAHARLRAELGSAARTLAAGQFDWGTIARNCVTLYGELSEKTAHG